MAVEVSCWLDFLKLTNKISFLHLDAFNKKNETFGSGKTNKREALKC